MFDIGATELLLIVIVAVIVIGPKDLPLAMRTAGRWIGRLRRVSSQFRAGLDSIVREAEMEDMQKEWDKRNAEIMAKYPEADAETGRISSASESTPAPETVPDSQPIDPLMEPLAEKKAEPAMEPLPLFDDGPAVKKPKDGQG